MSRIITFIFVFCASVTSGSAETCSSLQELDIILGDWQEISDAGATKETWRKVSEKSYEGSGATFNQSMIEQNRESLRLVEMSGEVFYIAKVTQNELPTSFKLTNCGQNHFVFENPTHDFPNKIVYRFEKSNKMKVNVSGVAGDSFQLNFTREKLKTF